VEQNDLRISLGEFVQELLKNDRKRVGRLDSRFTAFISDPGDAQSGFDPSEASIRNSFTSVLNDYMRGELNYFNDDVYYILGGGIGPWRYQGGAYPDVTPSLERAFAKNPAMRVYVAAGFYDGATPYWAVEYTLAHLRIAPEARQNIVVDYFDAGHMMYIDAPSMTKLRDGIRRFMQSSIDPSRT
jgi:carboxypeptidase C (cathepsin A)